MITFTSPSILPIEAATTMGVSVKENDNAIGKFGTGLKYAIAGILRLGGSIEIFVGVDRFEFRAVETDIRGRTFRLVQCNGVPCGFTTDLGKHWKPWQIFREIASNTLDERGSWGREAVEPAEDATNIVVACREVEDLERDEHVFLGNDRTVLVASSAGATIYAGPSQHYYFHGIRAGSFPSKAPVTVNVTEGSLSEDRQRYMAAARREIAWAFRTALKWDADLLLQVTAAKEPADFWCQNIDAYNLTSGTLPKDMMAFLLDRPKWVEHPAFRPLVAKAKQAGGSAHWTEVEHTERHEKLLIAGERLCAKAGVDPIPRAKVHFTTELGDDRLAITTMDTRDVWFSTQIALMGRDEFLAGYLEEALHAMTGADDCTRKFQNLLLAIIVGMASGEPPAVPAPAPVSLPAPPPVVAELVDDLPF
jgi:hypothetical protein